MKILTPTLIGILCDCTDISSDLLTHLENFQLISTELTEKINGTHGPSTKAKVLYDVLERTCTDGDLSKLKLALQKSMNKKALQEIEAAEKILRMSEDAGIVNAQAARVENTSPPEDVKVYVINGILSKDEGIVRNAKTLYKRFPNVELKDVMPIENKVSNGTANLTELIDTVITTWRSRHSSTDTNVRQLIEILEQDIEGQSFIKAAESLKGQLNVDSEIV